VADVEVAVDENLVADNNPASVARKSRHSLNTPVRVFCVAVVVVVVVVVAAAAAAVTSVILSK
jgi:hypothetical protein